METEKPGAGSRVSGPSLRVAARVRFREGGQPLFQFGRQFRERGSIRVRPRLDDQVDRSEQRHQAPAREFAQLAS